MPPMPLRTDEPRRAAPDPRIKRAASGDRQAAEQLLLEHLPRVRNLARYLLRGDSEVDDLAQVCMMEIMRSLPSYAGEGSFKAWVDRITVRAVFHHIRKRRVERLRDDINPDLVLVVAEGESPDLYSLRREAVRWLDELPADQRNALVLHHVLGFSVPEVSSELAVPAETVRSRLRLGMEKLRQKLGGGGAR
jgi:RNA polymerase sigma-70 factor (ECF subfamily)